SASRILRRHGIAGTRVADVMKGAGLTVGGFYAHWKSKQELVDETLRRTADQLRLRLFANLESVPEKKRASLILERYLAAKARDSDGLGCPLPAVVNEIGTTAPEHGPVLGETLEPFIARMRELVQTRKLAIGLIALMYGGLSLARATRGTPLSDEILAACRSVGQELL
ncbi:MAG TPA: TetR/AcrR family transcriptional regulator, partial [Kofleriaceae bacterium]